MARDKWTDGKLEITMIDRATIQGDDGGTLFLNYYSDDIRHGYTIQEVHEALSKAEWLKKRLRELDEIEPGQLRQVAQKLGVPPGRFYILSAECELIYGRTNPGVSWYTEGQEVGTWLEADGQTTSLWRFRG